jgi:glycine/D-amino acid oxidase-like deaminating enzyme
VADSEFDVVVVGAGAAGVCCAGEFVALGLRPLLICETPDVGWALRSIEVDGNRGFVQHPTWQIGWNGGWWSGLAKRLNVPVAFHLPAPLQLMMREDRSLIPFYTCSSAAAIADVFENLAPMPLGDLRPELERVLSEILALSWEEMQPLQTKPLSEWLDEHDCEFMLQMMLAVLFANVTETTPDVAIEYLSAYGAFAMLRGLVCSEAPTVATIPDVREGLLIPLANAIEAGGGEIRRRAKVAEVTVVDGRVTGLLLQSGEHIAASNVVLATGTRRVPDILPNPPAEVAAAIEFSGSMGRQDICTYTVLDDPVIDIHNLTMLTDADGNNLAFLFPMHAICPWTTQPGEQMLVAQAFYPYDEWDAMGGKEGVAKHLLALQDEMFPGFAKAARRTETLTHRHYWLDTLTHGPKLPGRCESVEGLWFAGDGSAPIVGIGVDGAAGAGISRARQVAAELRK